MSTTPHTPAVQIAESEFDGGHKLWEIFEVLSFDPVCLGERMEISRALLTARESGRPLKCVRREIDHVDGITFAIHDFEPAPIDPSDAKAIGAN